METSVDQARASSTHSNPMFDMSLSRTDLYSVQPDGEFGSQRKEPLRTAEHLIFILWAS